MLVAAALAVAVLSALTVLAQTWRRDVGGRVFELIDVLPPV